jgi:ERCC4-related helicase
MTKNSESKLELRGYQQKILSIALEMNTIAFLPTGAGIIFSLDQYLLI